MSEKRVYVCRLKVKPLSLPYVCSYIKLCNGAGWICYVAVQLETVNLGIALP